MTPVEYWRTLDDNGNVMPWYTRPCLAWLITLPLKTMTVFEYGCGVSSNWFIRNTAASYGVDNNQEWLPEKSEGYWYTKDKAEYINSPGHIEGDLTGYDIIVIDGIYRDDCTEYALKFLKKGGYLIADNFEQPSADLAHWPKTRELTKHLPLTIYKEPEHIDWQTAVWQYV